MSASFAITSGVYLMKKITDRFILGVISGLGGNLVKICIERVLHWTGFADCIANQKAAGIFLKKSEVDTLYGKVVGCIADNMIGMGLGVTCSYWLTLMGKDHYLLKGMGLGAAEWAGLYGVLSNMGATTVYPVKPQDAIAGFVSHLAFGATKATIMVQLGDESLFTPTSIVREPPSPQSSKAKSFKPHTYRIKKLASQN